MFLQFDAGAFHLRAADAGDFVEQFFEAGLFEPQLLRPHEIEKALHHRIQAVDFAIEHGNGLARHAIAGGQNSLSDFPARAAWSSADS